MEILRFIIGMLIAIATIAGMIAISSHMKKKGLLKGLLKTGTGTGKSEEDWWWDFCKPYFAIPTGWGLLHLACLFLFPDTFKEIFTYHLGIVITIELSALVLSSVINKKVDFDKRFSRIALNGVYIAIFILALSTIPGKLYYGKDIVEWDQTLYTKMSYSKAILTAEEIRQNSAQHTIKKKMARLDSLRKKSEKGKLPPVEELEVQALPEEIKRLASAVPGTEKKAIVRPQRPPRQMSGIFHLPANGQVVDKDIHGKELPYGVGGRLKFKQLGVPGKFTVVNRDIPSWSTDRITVTSGINISAGKIELENTGKNPVTVQVQVVPYRGT